MFIYKIKPSVLLQEGQISWISYTMFVHTKDSWDTQTAYLWFNGKDTAELAECLHHLCSHAATDIPNPQCPETRVSSCTQCPGSTRKATPCCFHLPCCSFQLQLTLSREAVSVTSHLVVQKCVHSGLSLYMNQHSAFQTVYLTVFFLLILGFPVCDTG